MKQYVVRQGDYLAKIAFAAGCSVDAIWKHPKNADVAAKRAPDVLAPGDLLFVPEAGASNESLQPSTSNGFARPVPKVAVHLALRGDDGPLASKRFCVEGAGDSIEGTTDPEGKVAFEVPVTVSQVTLRMVDDGLIWVLRIGDLDPVSEDTGAIARLRNLGFVSDLSQDARFSARFDPVDAETTLKDTVVLFQRTHGLEVTGALDEATRRTLVEAHGS